MRGPELSLWERLQEERLAQKERERGEVLAKATLLLKAYFSRKKVLRVYLVGSLTREGQFSRSSDIDVAVLGLQEDYFRTLTDLEELLDRPIDLIELEACPFREDVERRGLRIW